MIEVAQWFRTTASFGLYGPGFYAIRLTSVVDGNGTEVAIAQWSRTTGSRSLTLFSFFR